ncbi:arginine repressor [Mesobacillus boroniphilus]|uniref:Arginine repressor n=1 Tax=Mesobacillus boroniphilus TaxID=308892 RepID=A0A944CPQ3_9BACI|nr:arginine repressor [Mesobacillus boroniphilus]MBS8266282.1 arginine repressor [Mesobacillus boroniphilus]
MKKEIRLNLISHLVSQHEIKTQEELCNILQQNGMSVTQATVSRDIRELKLVKVPAKNGHQKYDYSTSHEQSVKKKLQNRLKDALIKMEPIHYFVLIKTLPGHAHSFGSLLDALEFKGKVGTICGNDTCLVICSSPDGAEAFHKLLESYLDE